MTETLQFLFQGFATATTLPNLGAALLGATLGLIVGAMPGIGSLAGVALLLPLTFKFNPTAAIIMLGAIYYSNMYGGAFSAILINVPGDAPAIMTALDGYPMARKGQPGKALLTSNIASCIGGAIGMVILVFMGPTLAGFGLNFGPSETAAMMLVALTSISWLVGENPIKGIVSTCLGILIASIGFDIVVGSARYDFGNIYLLGGINFIPLVIGFIGMAQVYELAGLERKEANLEFAEKLTIRNSLLSKHELKRIIKPSLRSGFIGTFVGFLPGAGATSASFISYAIQKKFGKNEVELGEGAIEGIAASEAANNAAAAGAFGPLLALGIPGSGTTAVLLGGLMMWGLSPGPMLFTNEPEFTWGLIASLFISNIMALIIALIAIPWVIKLLKVPIGIMVPGITVICFVGSYATTNSMFGVSIMIIGGILGYLFKKNDFPVSPLLLASILAPSIEVNVRRSMIISNGNLGLFVQRPITVGLLIIFVGIVGTPIVKAIIKKIRSTRAKLN